MSFDNLYYLGLCYHAEQKFTDAIRYLSQFIEKKKPETTSHLYSNHTREAYRYLIESYRKTNNFFCALSIVPLKLSQLDKYIRLFPPTL